MKYYLVKRTAGVDRWFTKQSDVTNFLIDVIGDEECKVITIDSTPQTELSSKEFISSIINETKRDTTIKVALGDPYSESVKKLINKLVELVNDSPNGKRVLEKLMTGDQSKEEFTKLVKKNSEYLLYNVSDTIEWYSILLDVYPFKKLDEVCRTEKRDKNTGSINMVGHRTPDKMLVNFQKALKRRC